MFLMHGTSVNLAFANVVYFCTGSVQSSVNKDLGFGNPSVKLVLSLM